VRKLSSLNSIPSPIIRLPLVLLTLSSDERVRTCGTTLC
jgi:hypothetical protein